MGGRGSGRCLEPPADGNCTVTGGGDFNRVNGVEVADIFDFLSAWFAGSANC